jgi:hypothetical protein
MSKFKNNRTLDSTKMCAKNKHFPFTKQINAINQAKLRSSAAHTASANRFHSSNG